VSSVGWLLVVIAAVSVVLVAALIEMRRRLRSTASERDALANQAAVISAAVRELTKLHHPDEVLDASVRIAAELTSPAVHADRRAAYFEVSGDVARVVAEYDESDTTATGPVALTDHPWLEEVVRTKTPTRTTFGAAVPIVIGEQLHGVLAVGSTVHPITEFDRLVELGNVVELALANALVTQELAEQATSDQLTGCANRRGLLLAAGMLSNRVPFAVIAADLDGLKELNDKEGHDVGDAALSHFTKVVQFLMRTGDVLARVGGDEFLLLLQNTTAHGGALLAQRILKGLHDHENLRVSLGVASATDPKRFDDAWLRADRAMYRAKGLGGMRFVSAEPAERLPEPREPLRVPEVQEPSTPE
jgi:diguanylate cyclase (GGDEF)-like protein